MFWQLCVLSIYAFAYASAEPIVRLGSATVTGISKGRTSQFLGIPFAQPPIGNLRLRRPVGITSYNESVNATAFGPACPGQALSPDIPDLPAESLEYIEKTFASWAVTTEDEDCLSLNIVAPANITSDDKLPVSVFLFGGGFELSGPAASAYDGTSMVEGSIDMGMPMIFVSVAYRNTALGFLGGKQVKEAGVGNLGLHDQREGLRWVRNFISDFGGDPSRVTLWGSSSGAISASMQMLANGGDAEGLFHAVFLNSGAPIFTGDENAGQEYYDFIVQETGCSDSTDPLDCLRGLDFKALKSAFDKTPNILGYQALTLAYLPRADGVFLEDHPQKLVQQGKVARLPLLAGNCDDEATLFSLANRNITTEGYFASFVKTHWFPNISEEDLAKLLLLYPEDPAAGSPFGTALANNLTQQFKRVAAFQGDTIFQNSRRYLLQQRADEQPTWGYVYKRSKDIPFLGSAHASDNLDLFQGGDMMSYFIRFVSTHNPNGNSSLLPWPQYRPLAPLLLEFNDGEVPLNITSDTYRAEAMDWVTKYSLEHPIEG